MLCGAQEVYGFLCCILRTLKIEFQLKSIWKSTMNVQLWRVYGGGDVNVHISTVQLHNYIAITMPSFSTGSVEQILTRCTKVCALQRVIVLWFSQRR